MVVHRDVENVETGEGVLSEDGSHVVVRNECTEISLHVKNLGIDRKCQIKKPRNITKSEKYISPQIFSLAEDLKVKGRGRK